MLRVERYRPELVTAASLSNKSVSAAELKELMDFPNLQLLVLTMAQLPLVQGSKLRPSRPFANWILQERM